MKIISLEKKDYKKYNDFLLSCKESLFYYSTNYKEFLEDLLNIKSNYLIAIDKDANIQAAMPLMIMDGKYGKIANSLPYYGSNGGILSKNNNAYELLLNEYYKISNQLSASTYITNPLNKYSKSLKYDFIDKRIGQLTSLSYEKNIEKSIFNNYESSAKRNIKKALRDKVVVELDNNQLEFLRKTHLKNISSIGGKVKSKKFFELINTYFKQNVDYKIYVAKIKGIKIAALLLFYFNETVEYFMPATLLEYRNFQALPLIIFNAMCDASKKKYKWWNWGGTWINQQGVYRFKKKFGSIDKEYKYFTILNNKKIVHSSKDELLKEYENFYVLKFENLKKNENC